MADELMTAEDVHILRLGLCLDPCTHADCERNHRILATYAALAAKTAECERLAGETIAAREMERRAWASLAAAREDTRRLSLLAKWAATPLELDRMGGLEGDAPVGPFFLTFRGDPDTQYSAATLRDVIDQINATHTARRGTE